MIPTSPTSPVSWTAAAAPAVAPVPAVMAVAPAAPAARDAQGNLEHRRGQTRPAQAPAADRADTRDPAKQAALEHAREQRVQEEAQRLEDMEVNRRETVEQLRQALRKAWDASAAVVEHALARESEALNGTQAARARDAYAPSTDGPDKPPGLSRRV